MKDKKAGSIKKDKIVLDKNQKTTVPEHWPDSFRNARCKHNLYRCPSCSK